MSKHTHSHLRHTHGSEHSKNSAPSDSHDMKHNHHGSLHGSARDFLKRFYGVTFLLLPLAFFTDPIMQAFDVSDFASRPYLQLLLMTMIMYVGRVFFQHARHEIEMRDYGMMTLVSIAVGAGYMYSAASLLIPSLSSTFYLEISSLIWILLFGHYLEARSSMAAGDALNEIATLLPHQAHKIVGKQIVETPLSQLKAGDIVMVKSGERVPADGVITVGSASFDESHITGESTPIEKKRRAELPAGAICLDSSVRLRLTRVGESSTVGQIAKLVRDARHTKPNAQLIADKAARMLTGVALSVSLVSFVVWTVIMGKPLSFSITLAITVLVIACPHALGLAIPAVSSIGTRLAVRHGLFIKDLKKLELIRKVSIVVFDKTGTLTQGEFGVTDVLALERREKDVIRIAASLETHSSHAIAQSIVTYAKRQKISPSAIKNFKEIPGKGLQADIRQNTYFVGSLSLMKSKNVWTKDAAETFGDVAEIGKTVVFVADMKHVIGMIALADKVRVEAEDAIFRLHQMGVKTAMLTGDNEAVAKSVAGRLRIDRYFSHVLPRGKYSYIQKLQQEGNVVMMVGDGINDAPALTQADVGVAIGAGTDIAADAGDIILSKNNPEDIVRLIKLSHIVSRKMIENLFWALGYNAVAIPLAAGILIPWGVQLRPEIGAIFMSLSSVIVVANAMNLQHAELK